MFASVGLPELLILSIIILVFVYPAWRIVGKTGYPGALCLVCFVPLVNLLMFLFFAFSEWPIEKELKLLRR